MPSVDEPITSDSLLRRSIDGDSNSWNRLVYVYAQMIYNWLRRAGVCEHDANEIIQEVFVSVLKNLSTFRRRHGKTFRGWLWTITKNKMHDARKKRLLSLDPIDMDKMEAKPWDAEDTVVPPSEILRRCSECLDDVSDRDRYILKEVVMAGRQATDVADELGVSANTIYIAKGRLLKKIRDSLTGLEYPKSDEES